MNNFIYDIPTKVYFGQGVINHLAGELQAYGKRVLLAYGGGSIKKTGLYDKVIEQIEKAGMQVFELQGIQPNPRIDSVREGVKLCKQNGIDLILAVGGGSTIDCCKFIAAGAVVDFDPWDFMDLTKRAKIEKALPIIDILTLSATGSEMDCGGVISNPETNEKIGRQDPLLQPKVSFLDPTLTYTVSPYQTACGSADMISHIFEVYFTMDEDLYMLDTMMEGLLKTIIKYAPIAMQEPENYEARANLMWASSWAINGFINGGKQTAWSCHPMEHELSAFYDITHGLGLAILTPRWMRYCLNERTVDKYVQFAVNVLGVDKTLDKMAIANKGIELMEEFFFETLGLKSTLEALNIDQTHFDLMAQKAVRNSSIKGFVELKQEDVKNIYQMCLR